MPSIRRDHAQGGSLLEVAMGAEQLIEARKQP